MFYRGILQELVQWKENSVRKPLVIRGARQVGKTTLVHYFSRQFDNYIYLNLELAEDRRPFEQFTTVETLVKTLFFLKNITLSEKGKTLLFIDEIQAAPEAISILRYFYEQEPELPVIAAGSMLENLFDKNVSFPVGRVEYKVLRPVSFLEFLGAIGETAALEELKKIPIASFAHEKLLSLFHTYSIIGGMPEVVNHYAQHKDLAALSPIYDSLIISYLDDAEKYAKNFSQLQMIRHALKATFAQAGKRIKYQGFGNSNYGSREMGEVLRTLEKALLVYLVYPDTGYTLPLLPDLKKSPRLHVLDTGLMNYFVGIQKEILGTADLNTVYKGTMIEHLVGQELLVTRYNALSSLHFWVREKKTSMAEVDYLYPYDSKLFPIEVKSGAEGKLKSLHLFMDEAPHSMAFRFYSGGLTITRASTPNGKKYSLLNLPYYLVSQVDFYIEWFEKQQ